jgi:hypothetical protein
MIRVLLSVSWMDFRFVYYYRYHGWAFGFAEDLSGLRVTFQVCRDGVSRLRFDGNGNGRSRYRRQIHILSKLDR